MRQEVMVTITWLIDGEESSCLVPELSMQHTDEENCSANCCRPHPLNGIKCKNNLLVINRQLLV